VPACIFLFVGVHLVLVLHNGISEPPVPGVTVNPATYRAEYEERMKKHGQPFWPDSAWRDVVFSVLMIGVICGLAAFIGPPKLGPPPDPAIVDAPFLYFSGDQAVADLTPGEVGGLRRFFALGGVLVVDDAGAGNDGDVGAAHDF